MDDITCYCTQNESTFIILMPSICMTKLMLSNLNYKHGSSKNDSRFIVRHSIDDRREYHRNNSSTTTSLSKH